MGSFSLLHWIIVLVVVLLLFGPKRLPDLAKGMGDAIREFKKAVNAPDQPPAQRQVGEAQPPPQISEAKNTQVAQNPNDPTYKT